MKQQDVILRRVNGGYIVIIAPEEEVTRTKWGGFVYADPTEHVCRNMAEVAELLAKHYKDPIFHPSVMPNTPEGLVVGELPVIGIKSENPSVQAYFPSHNTPWGAKPPEEPE